MSLLKLCLTCCVIVSIYGFGGSEDRFIKKYAMMKIYESCFGNEVIKQIRNEMKAAGAKCASYNMAYKPHFYQPAARPIPAAPPKMDEGFADPDNTIYANAQAQIDVEKINQAILGYRPVQHQKYPFPNVIPGPFRPYQTPGIYAGYPNPASMYLPNMYQQFLPYGSSSPFAIPFLGHQYYSGQRTARNIDSLRNQMELLTSKMSGRAKNVTCIMQQLGYLDDNLEPNYAKITERISRLPIQEELRNDIQEGLTFCQQFSQCIPEVNKEKSPLSKEFFRPMFFFKCYKYKKMEACVMKDIREKYSGFQDEDFDGTDMDIQRNARSMRNDEKDEDDLGSSVYEYLYGGDELGDLDFF
ncbi:hypothetical protein PPYR_09685 [Photinus pyralis]|uniref:Uncharacterized protein n=2 Tax=Photinus pyralis TaxID=7054 RepID=A0A5N4AMV7_PHOPY|nr:uncharacterized protein LOC116171435 [Photinus pyralis]XP_031344146.1 uncharacterized protein LOC116171435 [Photinus pyralis]XP_031344147.1 uncharacterized protein LOC116171435 [Photinus pyralis]KAB0798692.1 hypothetical protein PPYR_09685 [Photinus pyralis]